MLYRKITIVCEGAEERLNRVLQVRSDVDLMTLGYIILESMNAEFDSTYHIEDTDIWYVTEDIFDRASMKLLPVQRLALLSESHLSDLSDQFFLKYFDDSEEADIPWNFRCTLDKKELRKASDIYAYMLDGKGMGIWEGEREAYFSYLNGEIDPELDCDTEDAWVPDNLEIETYGETDTAFDLEIAKEDFEDDMDPDFVKTEIEYILHRSEYLDEDDDWDDDEWDDDDWDEDDPFDFLDNKEMMTKGAMAISLMTVAQHIESLDFVAEKYNELCERHTPEESAGILLNVVLEFLEDFMSGDLLENNKEYRKKIKNLK